MYISRARRHRNYGRRIGGKQYYWIFYYFSLVLGLAWLCSGSFDGETVRGASLNQLTGVRWQRPSDSEVVNLLAPSQSSRTSQGNLSSMAVSLTSEATTAQTGKALYRFTGVGSWPAHPTKVDDRASKSMSSEADATFAAGSQNTFSNAAVLVVKYLSQTLDSLKCLN